MKSLLEEESTSATSRMEQVEFGVPSTLPATEEQQVTPSRKNNTKEGGLITIRMIGFGDS